ncbi:hypothetical protein [Aurantivibrio plasticivorans]
MAETSLEIIALLYRGLILLAICSYGSQQKILLDMCRGVRAPSKDVSLVQFWIWTAGNLIATLYAIFQIQTDIPLIVLGSVNFINSLITALLNSYVHHLCSKRKYDED